jgi:hypothetical protein
MKFAEVSVSNAPFTVVVNAVPVTRLVDTVTVNWKPPPSNVNGVSTVIAVPTTETMRLYAEAAFTPEVIRKRSYCFGTGEPNAVDDVTIVPPTFIVPVPTNGAWVAARSEPPVLTISYSL